MKTALLLIIAAIALTGCNQERLQPQALHNPQGQTLQNGRFTLERVGIVKDSLAYGNERGIYILRDTKTGEEYVGVSGVGITVLGSHQAGKSRIRDER